MKRTSKRTAASRKRSPVRSRPAPLERALVRFAALAKREHTRWYVFGAQAVALHGVPRMTADLDITIELGPGNLKPFIGKLTRAGFVPRFADEAFLTATRVLPVVHRATGFPIDLVLAGAGLEMLFLDRVELREIGGHDIPVLTVEDLVVTKLLAGRPKDLQDIRELISLPAAIDHQEVERLLAQIEIALDQSDLRPLYAMLRLSPARAGA